MKNEYKEEGVSRMTAYRAERKRKRALRREQDREYAKGMRKEREKHPDLTWWNKHWMKVFTALWVGMLIAIMLVFSDWVSDASASWENSSIC